MELNRLIASLRCPVCKAAPVIPDGDAAICSACGHRLPVYGRNVDGSAEGSGLSSEWAEMQEGSVERYLDEDYEADETIANIFAGFIALTLRDEDDVFDVGCGLFEETPAYARDLRCKGYVGLEPLTTKVDRHYTCLTGAVAEALPLQDRTFDAALFATSLDHIEHVKQALDEVGRILRPGGRMYFWVGVHEPEIVAQTKTFRDILYRGSRARRIVRGLAAYVEYGVFLWRMRKRQRHLDRGIALDHAHFRYYTVPSLRAELERCGLTIERTLLAPGTNAYLIEATTGR